MKILSSVMQWGGYILSLVVLFTVYFQPENESFIFIGMLIAILIGLIGGLLGDMSKVMVLSLFFGLLAVLFYFYLEQGVLFKLSLFICLALMIVDWTIKIKRKKVSSS
ncbi:hypothetical protein [Bacillus infantis]|uniref:hypothetical protein n=1 Tax=Bacillus infantis TaxID=324767 RepID=UPI0020A0E889|nr:hypothetical protein [Bacillus infantis]MCP1161408.1 hypothetical protein [Bacillus infantis]